MLFVDGPFVTANDLDIIDGEFSVVAAKEKIVVDGSSSSVLSHSILSAGSDFTAHIQNFSGYLVGVGVNSNHLAAVLNILSTAINRPRALLSQITVKEPNVTRTSFVRWVRYCCLYDFYRTLFARRISEDRFRLKMLMYEEEKKRHWGILRGTGFPVVLSPFACPGAVWEYGSGEWGEANVTAGGSGSAETGNQYDVVITWVSVPPYINYANQAGAESGGSSKVTITVPPTQVLSVNLNNLNPPTGLMQVAIGTAPGVYSPMAASGWNVYVGLNGQRLYLQNTTPIPIDTTSFTLPDAPVLSGNVLNEGQPAQYDFTIVNVLWRG